MKTEEKNLKIIIVSDEALDISKLGSPEYYCSNTITGNARDAFLKNLKQDFNTDTDLIIRLNGSKSLNNSVISEACYAEIYFSDKNEDSFSKEDLEKAIGDFHNRKRNFGI